MAKHTLKVPKAKEFDQMSSDELREMLSQLKLRKMAIDGSNKSPIAHPIDHPSGEARQNRKSIARIMTENDKRDPTYEELIKEHNFTGKDNEKEKQP